MKRSALTPLGETEMEVLQHVWALRRATVADVHGRILASRKVAYTTVMTVMKNLADKGYLAYEKEGLAYVYAPARSAEQVRGSLVRGLVRKVFDGSPLALVQTLVRAENLSEEDLRALRALVDGLEDDEDRHDDRHD